MVFQNRDFLAGLIFLLIGAVLLVFLIPAGIDEPQKVKFAVMSPSYYPRIIGIVMAFIGLTITIGAIISKTPASHFSDMDAQSVAKVVAVFIAFLLTAYALPYAGFVLTCTLCLVFLMTLAGERNPLILAPVALLLPICLYLFFTKIANVPIPGGILETYLQRV
ncbi:MAG: tripartite tricarboxylate transporter TctB family protein [Hyphomicrobiaceae bacterium]